MPCCLSPNASQVCRFLEIPIQQYLARRWSLTLFWRRRTDTVRSRYDRVGLYRLAKYTSWLARPRSQLHCVIFVGSLFVHFVACRLGMAAGGPLWCCCPGAFGRGHASMARSGVGDHGLVGICGCPIRAALGWGTAVVVPVLAATTTCPVAWVRFHCCFIVIFFSKYVYLCCVWEMGAYEHIHVHVDEILVWNWVSPDWLFP